MLIPQRATLFGWAVLFPLLYVLYRAVYEHCERYFIIAGIFAGGLVMIHTHYVPRVRTHLRRVALLCTVPQSVPGQQCSCAVYRKSRCTQVLMLLAFGAQFVTPKLISRESSVFLYLVLVCAAAFVLFVLALLIMAIRKGFGIQLVKTWGVFLLIALLLAAPQLFTWTFSQASGDSFMRGWYNWGNLQDGYLLVLSCESRRHGAVVPACIFHGRSAPVHGLRSRSRHLVHLRVCRVPAEYL